MDYGMKVSQTGNNVLTTAKENLIFSSKFNTLKVYVSGSGQVMVPPYTGAYPTWTPGKNQVVITHDLGYRPLAICFVTNPLAFNDNRMAPYTYMGIGGPHNIPSYGVTNTQLIMTFYSGWNVEYMYYYKYHIYYNELGEVESH